MNHIKVYTCPPIKELSYCTQLEIESIDKNKTNFLFSNGFKTFRLSLLNTCFVLNHNSIQFSFNLKGKQINFMALKKEDDTYYYGYTSKGNKVYDPYKIW